MSKKLRALLVKENELPVEIEIPNNLTSLQKQVGGYIEYFYMPEIEDAVIICNEEGRIKNYRPTAIVNMPRREHFVILGEFFV